MERTVIASTDQYIEEFAKSSGKTYNEVFKECIAEAEKFMRNDVQNAIAAGHDIVWDQTNVSKVSRNKKLRMIPDHYEKIAVVFPVPDEDELQRRLASRPGKTIPSHVMSSMIANYQMPTLEEGFTEIIHL